MRGVSDPRRLRQAPFPAIELPLSGLAHNYSGSAWTSNIPSSRPGIPSEWSNNFSLAPSGAPAEQINGPSIAKTPPYLVQSVSSATHRQGPAPPYPSHPIDISPFDEATHAFLAPKKDVRQNLTPGQASLFDALFSLALPEDNNDLSAMESLSFSNPYPQVSSGPSYILKCGVDQVAGQHLQEGPEDSQDAQEVGAKLCDSLALTLDRKVKSNTLPFVLQSYALWMRQFLFEPVRIIPLARDYITDEYSEGPGARWRMMAVSNAIRSIIGSTGYTLEDVEILQPHMYQGFAATIARLRTGQGMDKMESILAMSTTYELIALSVKVLSLSKVVQTMQTIAPIFRCACPDPGDRPINLPSLLSNINIPLEYYATLDIILSASLNRPMNFRYDTTYPPGVYGSVFDLENGPGTRWAYGIPDRLVIILARMNVLLEDFGSRVDPEVIEELEMELKDMKAVVVTSADPSLEVGRLLVQECWRQAAYIYLYMGLCGADSHDARVVRARRRFMEIFVRTKPGRIPDSFLILPLPILGIATRHPADQELLKRRMLSLPEVSRKGTTGNQFTRILDNIWELANQSGRAATWADLRLASLLIAGV